MSQTCVGTLFLASVVLASSAIHHIRPRQRDDVAYLYSSIEMAREGTTFETNLNDWESAVEAQNMTDWDNLLGFDITKPYLDRDQSRVSQFPMRLNIVSNYPLPADGDTRFTTITSVSISAPPEIKAGNNTGTPRSIDPSWNLCFGYFYFDHDLNPVDDLGDSREPCAGYLSDGEECVNDIEAWLAEEFQSNNACPFQDDPASAKLPESCEKVTSSELVMFRNLGPSSDFASDRVFGNEAPAAGFSVGTGANEAGDEQGYRTSGLRTVLVTAIWGYNINDTSLEPQEEPDAPPVTLSCLRGRRGVVSGSSLPEEVGSRARSSFGVSPWSLWTLPALVVAFL